MISIFITSQNKKRSLITQIVRNTGNPQKEENSLEDKKENEDTEIKAHFLKVFF